MFSFTHRIPNARPHRYMVKLEGNNEVGARSASIIWKMNATQIAMYIAVSYVVWGRSTFRGLERHVWKAIQRPRKRNSGSSLSQRYNQWWYWRYWVGCVYRRYVRVPAVNQDQLGADELINQ